MSLLVAAIVVAGCKQLNTGLGSPSPLESGNKSPPGAHAGDTSAGTARRETSAPREWNGLLGVNAIGLEGAFVTDMRSGCLTRQGIPNLVANTLYNLIEKTGNKPDRWLRLNMKDVDINGVNYELTSFVEAVRYAKAPFDSTDAAHKLQPLKVLAIVEFYLGTATPELNPPCRNASGTDLAGGCTDMTAVFGPAASPAPKLSALDLNKFNQRLRKYFDALHKAGLVIDAFQIGNELDWAPNNGDVPLTDSGYCSFAGTYDAVAGRLSVGASVAAHDQQVRKAADAYAILLANTKALLEEYPEYRNVPLVTFGLTNPSSWTDPFMQPYCQRNSYPKFSKRDYQTFFNQLAIRGSLAIPNLAIGVNFYAPINSAQFPAELTYPQVANDLKWLSSLFVPSNLRIWITETGSGYKDPDYLGHYIDLIVSQKYSIPIEQVFSYNFMNAYQGVTDAWGLVDTQVAACSLWNAPEAYPGSTDIFRHH